MTTTPSWPPKALKNTFRDKPQVRTDWVSPRPPPLHLSSPAPRRERSSCPPSSLRWPIIGVKHGGEGNLLLLPLPQPKHAPNGLKADARITEYTHEDDVVTVFQRRCPYHWTCQPPPRAPPAYGRSGYQSLKILSFSERTPHSTGWEVGHRTSGATCPFPYRSGGSSLPVTSAWQMAQQYTPPCRLLLSMGRLRANRGYLVVSARSRIRVFLFFVHFPSLLVPDLSWC